MQSFSESIRVATDNTLGWHLKAANEIQAGEIILEEQPLFLTPHWDCERMKCANCLQDSFVMCKKCQLFPLCLDCKTHDEFDCQFMAKIVRKGNLSNSGPSSSSNGPGISQDLLVKNNAIYAVLKLLLLMENEKTRQYCESVFPPVIDLNDEYRTSAIWLDHEEHIVTPIVTSGILPFFTNIIKRRGADIDADFLHELCFLIDANGFEVTCKYSGECLKAVYTAGTNIPHNCVPNTVISFDENSKLRIYAALPIRNGETIFNSYVNPLMGTAQRQLQLRLSRQIQCHCPRCSDPTEVNTHMSTLKCQQCTDGLILQERPLNNGNWKCNKCNAFMSNETVNNLLAEIADKIAIANNELEIYEELLRTYEHRFHANHFIIIDIKQNIASLIGTMLMNPYGQIERSLLERKFQISDEVLPLVRAVQPGISKLYTVALYDYIILFMELMELRFKKKEIPRKDFVAALQRANSMMHEVVTMLSYEPTNSTEGHLSQRILMEKKQIEQQLQSVTELAT